jgi:hypothetical protein
MNNKEYHEEDSEMEGGAMGCMGHMHHWPKKMKREFKMALLKKKEKMLEAKLEFIQKIRSMMEKMPDEPKEEKEIME